MISKLVYMINTVIHLKYTNAIKVVLQNSNYYEGNKLYMDEYGDMYNLIGVFLCNDQYTSLLTNLKQHDFNLISRLICNTVCRGYFNQTNLGKCIYYHIQNNLCFLSCVVKRVVTIAKLFASSDHDLQIRKKRKTV